ncbi:endo-1,3-alpha-glucanase family glycosylhydrolase [Bradyrhizobium sp. NC92]|uniref:endo-1,3-alpha-glucanase family glycosylhydrolase n=1 Tax=Bradyrhizobium sp. (strain NC92) TaxID=55395 RepID=UPI0021AA4FC6|nr:endo-1,3-alpha-glucanase family glycosylhydrolase [Bradyrhizobium sp. NC92]UWU67624.1 endo-1,3-alpha-glucanase family glycosylhydrolase [Bradyrhizobium sp. NC92]
MNFIKVKILRIPSLLTFAVVSLLVGGDLKARSQEQVKKPLVFAHYMHCYVLGAYQPTDERVRNPKLGDNLKDWPPMGRESSWYSADLAQVASDGEVALAREFELMKEAGVDAIGLLLGPRMLPISQFARGLDMVADVATRSSTKIIPEFWANPWADDFETFGKTIKHFMDAHPGAFLVRDGKPMFIFAFDSGIAAKVHDPLSAPIKQISDFLEPWGGLDETYTMFYVPYQFEKAVRSPLILKSNAIDVWTPQDDWSALHSPVVFRVGSALNKEVAFPVSPAFYQRRAGQLPMEYGNSFGAARYIDGWLEAIKNRPAFVNIQTWNDFSEDTAIVPTNTAGRVWLYLTTYFSSWLRSGRQPAIQEERVVLLRPKQLANAKLKNPKAKAINAVWRHASPTVDYLDVVTFLREPASVRIILGTQTWERWVPAGVHEWIVHSSLIEGKGFAAQAKYPTASWLRRITVTDAFESAAPKVQLFRDNRLIGDLQSKTPFLDYGEWQDLTIIADEIALR